MKQQKVPSGRRALVIGGTGHIGSYLTPRLVRRGYEVTVVARTPQPKYTLSAIGWQQVRWLLCDRRAEEASGAWAKRMAACDVDVVVDLTTYTLEQNQMMVAAFKGRIAHFINCGSIWAYGPSAHVPYLEHYPRRPISDYGRNKTAVENELMALYRNEGFPVTVIHPGHISGRRWLPIDPRGALDGTAIYRKLATGGEVVLPERGAVPLHHVHGDDVAQLFELALDHPGAAIGETFSAVAPYAMTMRGCSEAVAALFGRQANLAYCSLDELRDDPAYACILSHVEESVVASPAKAERLLGFRPRYTTEEIYAECIEEMLENGSLNLA